MVRPDGTVTAGALLVRAAFGRGSQIANCLAAERKRLAARPDLRPRRRRARPCAVDLIETPDA